MSASMGVGNLWSLPVLGSCVILEVSNRLASKVYEVSSVVAAMLLFDE